MRVLLLLVGIVVTAANHADGQSLLIQSGERAAEGSIGWSVGPFSQGIEVFGGASLDGRWDVGFGLNRYSVDLGGPDDATLTEWTPWVRYFLFKEADDGSPISLAAHAQFFNGDYEGDDDGWYVLGGAQLYKKLELGDALALYPYVGFSLAGESVRFGEGDAERALYLTRQFGVHTQIALGADAWIRVTTEEHSFRHETYRAVRAAYVRRF